MAKKRGNPGLVQAGQLDLIKQLSRRTREPRGVNQKFLDTAVEIHQDEPDAEDLAYMARELVQCTLPHSDPGQISFWTRTNGNTTLSILSDYDPSTNKLVG